MKRNFLVEVAEARKTRRMRIPLAVRFGLQKAPVGSATKRKPVEDNSGEKTIEIRKEMLKEYWDDNTGQNVQVYNALFDEEGDVYLELEGFQFEAASSSAIGVVNGKPHLVVQLPREWAQKIGLLADKKSDEK